MASQSFCLSGPVVQEDAQTDRKTDGKYSKMNVQHAQVGGVAKAVAEYHSN